MLHTLRGILGIAMLAVLFHYVNMSDVVNSVRRANIWYLLAAIVLASANIGIQILKWRYFVRLINPESTNLESIASYMFGMALGTVTPGQIGEFGGRALRHSSITAGAIVGLTLVDKLQMISVLGIAGVVSLPFLFHLGSGISVLIILPSSLALFGLFFNPGVLTWMMGRLNLKFLKRQPVQDFVQAIAVFRPPQLWWSLFLSVSFYLVICLQMYLLLNALSEVDLVSAFLGFAPMMLVKALFPISLGDLGVREAGSVYFYSFLGIEPSTALSAALLLFLINVFAPSVVGIVFMPRTSAK